MENKYHSFEDLIIWQESLQLCMEIYKELKSCRDFKLRDQIQDSSVSIPSNIAEGFELQTNRQFIRHLYISKGSSGELRTQLYIAIDQGYITTNRGTELIDGAKRVASMIQKFIESRKKRNRRLLQ